MSIKDFQKLFLSSAGVLLLSLFFIGEAFNAGAQTHKKKKSVENEMTVIEVAAPQKGGNFYIVTFTRSQRRYKLLAKNASKYAALLKASAKAHSPVLIERSREESDTILSVRKVVVK